MKLKVLLPAILLVLPATISFAQHSDVELGYNDTSNPTAFIIEQDVTTTDGIQLFESGFEALDPFTPTDLSSDEPGFATAPDEGLLVNPGDQIWLRVLDASAHSSFGVGYVNFYNPTTDTLEASGRLAVEDNSGGTADLVINGGSIESGLVNQFLGTADGAGDVHDHMIVDLLDDSTAPIGAYGVLFQLTADFDSPDGSFDLDSDPFWIVWNHGMDEEDFESSLTAFGISAVPEPGSAAVLIALSGLAFLRRRK